MTQIKGKINYAGGLEELTLLNDHTTHRFNAIPIKIAMAFFIELEQILKDLE